jgi:uncharacterized repeat protein (TIGR01451 family)
MATLLSTGRHYVMDRLGTWLLAGMLGVVATLAQADPITRFTRYTGNINFVATGGTLRTQPNTGDACAIGASSSQQLLGIPGGATVRAAYLYWGGSGTVIDSSVLLNGSGVTASRTFTSVIGDGTGRVFFGGFADVTSRISGNGLMTFSGLTVDNGGSYCSTATVVAGWSLVVVYESPSERLRAINVFDGLDTFFGSQLALTPDGFRIPASNIDGRLAVITWDGDPGNSTTQNGFSETLRFNGTALDDGINVAGSNPLVQQYDGTVNGLGVATSYGVDVDTYDISALLTAGQTSASTVYSAGADRVFLAAQIVSVTSQPTVDLSIIKTHSGNFVVGNSALYTLQVSNAAGQQREDNIVTVTDTLPNGLTFVSGTGAGWSCSAAGQVVTCTHAPFLDPGQSLPAIVLTVAVGEAAVPSVANTASVSSLSIDSDAANNSITDTATVVGPSLATSTKTVVDLNGGDADPGDVLRYTLTLIESGGYAVNAASVTDDVPANVTGFTLVSLPAGASNASTGAGTGSNGTGFVNISNIAVPASGSVTVVFEVTVAVGTSPGSQIANTAIIDNPQGPDASPTAPVIIVSESQLPGSGTKALYLYGLSGGAPAYPLSRTAPATVGAAVTLGNNASNEWRLNAPLQTPVTLQSGSHAVRLWLSRNSSGGNGRNVVVTLGWATSLAAAPTIISTATTTFAGGTVLGTVASLRLVTLTLPTAVTVPAGSYFTLTVQNTTGVNNRNVIVSFAAGVTDSRVELNSASVIDVQSVGGFNAAYNGGVTGTTFVPGSTVYARAVVSDPFGSFDIAGATVTIRDPANAIAVNAAVMPMVDDSLAATRTYEYAFPLPPGAPSGGWTISVTAREGIEGVVTDLGNAGFLVATLQPALRVQKTSEVLSDPVNGAANPKRIPGSVQRYAVTVTNTGAGTVDSSTLIITDAVPGSSVLYVATGPGSPVEFVDGTPASGLSFNPAVHVGYSSQPGGGAPFNYTPVPDADGYDAQVTGLRIATGGTMNGASVAGQPSFTVRFRVRVN